MGNKTLSYKAKERGMDLDHITYQQLLRHKSYIKSGFSIVVGIGLFLLSLLQLNTSLAVLPTGWGENSITIGDTTYNVYYSTSSSSTLTISDSAAIPTEGLITFKHIYSQGSSEIVTLTIDGITLGTSSTPLMFTVRIRAENAAHDNILKITNCCLNPSYDAYIYNLYPFIFSKKF